MATRTAAERAALLAAWRARHPGRQPPTHIDPPGAHAPARPSRESRRIVEEVVAGHRREVAHLTEAELRALEPAFAQAERELADALRKWIERAPDGELRWTAQHYRSTLAQLREGHRLVRARLGGVPARAKDVLRSLIEQIADTIGGRLGDQLLSMVDPAAHMAVRHVAGDLARFSEVFEGSIRPVHLEAAKVLATSKSYLIPRYRTSAARYSDNIQADLRQRLVVDILKGAPIRETVDRLVEHGGPRGWVALRGVLGEEGSRAEFIAEGLFKRYRYWAERIVRTETSSAYGAATLESLHEASDSVPGLKKIWLASPACCASICAEIDGEVVPLDKQFSTPVGPCDHNPAHPNCRCSVSSWCDRWGEPPHLREDQKGEDADRRLEPPQRAEAAHRPEPPERFASAPGGGGGGGRPPFDIDRMSAAADAIEANHRRGFPGELDDQQAMREEARALVRSFGAVDRDAGKLGRDRYILIPPGEEAGIHYPDSGEMEIAENHHAGLADFLAAVRRGDPVTAQQVDAFTTLVHETNHGSHPVDDVAIAHALHRNPALAQAERSERAVREVATETAARSMMREAFPALPRAFSEGEGPLAMPGGLPRSARAYDEAIDRMTTVLMDVTGESTGGAEEMLTRASLGMLRHAGPAFADPSDSLRFFIDQLPLSDAAALREAPGDVVRGRERLRARILERLHAEAHTWPI